MAMSNIDNEMILMAQSEGRSFSIFTWIADSGATTHMANSLNGMFNLVESKTNVSVGDGRKMTTLKAGCWRGTAIDLEGTKKKITLTNV